MARLSEAAFEQHLSLAVDVAAVLELEAEIAPLKQRATALDHGLDLLLQAHASIRQCSGNGNPDGYKMAWLLIKTMRQVGNVSAATTLVAEVEAAADEWTQVSGRRYHRCCRTFCLNGWAGIVVWPQSTLGASDWLMLKADCRCANGAPGPEIAEAIFAAVSAGWDGEVLQRPALKDWFKETRRPTLTAIRDRVKTTRRRKRRLAWVLRPLVFTALLAYFVVSLTMVQMLHRHGVHQCDYAVGGVLQADFGTGNTDWAWDVNSCYRQITEVKLARYNDVVYSTTTPLYVNDYRPTDEDMGLAVHTNSVLGESEKPTDYFLFWREVAHNSTSSGQWVLAKSPCIADGSNAACAITIANAAVYAWTPLETSHPVGAAPPTSGWLQYQRSASETNVFAPNTELVVLPPSWASLFALQMWHLG